MWGDLDNPTFTATIWITSMMAIHLMTIIFALQAITHIIFLIPQAPKISVVLGTGILIVNHFLLVRKGKHQRIVEEFQNETIEERRKRTWWITFYFIASFCLLGLSVYLLIILR